MNEEESRTWKAGIVADYRLEGICIFLGLGLLLHLKAGGWQALLTAEAAGYFAAGFLVSYFLVGELNYQIMIVRARLRAKEYAGMSRFDKGAEIARARRVVRFLQLSVCLLVPWLAYELIYAWRLRL